MPDSPESPELQNGFKVSRRWMLASGATAVAAVPLAEMRSTQEAYAEPPPPVFSGGAMPVTLTVNGQTRHLALDSRTTLLDALRDYIGLTASKKGCDHGQCGACTVHIGGRRVLSCLVLAASVRQPVTTIEGLGRNGGLHPMQQAFLDTDAFQCGYCTPGQIMSAVACVQEGHAGSDAEIAEYMSGNLCRCAAYPHIVAAIKQAKAAMERT